MYDIKREYLRFMLRRENLCKLKAHEHEELAKELIEDAAAASKKADAKKLIRKAEREKRTSLNWLSLAEDYHAEHERAERVWQDNLLIPVKPTYNDPLEKEVQKLGGICCFDDRGKEDAE